MRREHPSKTSFYLSRDELAPFWWRLPVLSRVTNDPGDLGWDHVTSADPDPDPDARRTANGGGGQRSGNDRSV